MQNKTDRSPGPSLVQQPSRETPQAAELGVGSRHSAARHEHSCHGGRSCHSPISIFSSFSRSCSRAIGRGRSRRLPPPGLDQPAPPASHLPRPELLRVLDCHVCQRRSNKRLFVKRHSWRKQQRFRLQELVLVRQQDKRPVRQLRSGCGLVHVDEKRRNDRNGRMGRRSGYGIASTRVQQVIYTIFKLFLDLFQSQDENIYYKQNTFYFGNDT